MTTRQQKYQQDSQRSGVPGRGDLRHRPVAHQLGFAVRHMAVSKVRGAVQQVRGDARDRRGPERLEGVA